MNVVSTSFSRLDAGSRVSMGGLAAGERREQTGATSGDWSLPGLVGNVRVSTIFGDRPVEALRLRDHIRTAAGSIALIEWIDKIHLDAAFLSTHPSARPVRIPANAFGPGRPLADMVVSPKQDICPDIHVASRFSHAEDLCARVRGQRMELPSVTYYRFHCGKPITIRVEGVLTAIGGRHSAVGLGWAGQAE